MILEPEHVVKAVVKKLKSQKGLIRFGEYEIKTIAEIAEMPDEDSGFSPPWLGVYYLLDDEGEVLEGGIPDDVPVTIGILCSSTPGQSSSCKALAEAMAYAKKIIPLVIGEYEINSGTEEEPMEHLVYLRAHARPREIIQANSDLSMVVARFFYIDDFST